MKIESLSTEMSTMRQPRVNRGSTKGRPRCRPRCRSRCRSLVSIDTQSWVSIVHMISIRKGTGSVTTMDWCLTRLLQPTYRSHYPLLSFAAEVCFSCPVSNAWPERAASVLKWQKSMLCSHIKNDLLNPLLQITINGPKQDSIELPTLMQKWS